MTGKKAQLRGVLGAFALLAAVSFYRQLSMRLWPDDPVRPYLVYAVYLALLFFWAASIRSRFTQRNMRLFLFSEIFVMLLWLSIRFVQETAAAENIYLVRILGYGINIPAVAVPLLGFYAAFGLGRGDEYRFSGKWYLLLLPAGALIAMALTNESHHFLCYVLPNEPQPNLYFHPYIGTYLIYAWCLALIAARTAVLYRRSRPSGKKRGLAAFFEPLALLAFCAPYTAASFWVKWELIELSAGVFFLEAVSWELFIYLGLIPVNTQYRAVFDRSTAGMQIVSEDGRPIVRSASAPVLTEAQFSALRQNRHASAGAGQELQIYRIQNGYFIWQRDVSQLNSVIAQLRRSAAALEQESVLLSQELKIKSEEAAVAEQNRIYDRLSVEVGPQLHLLRQLLAKRDAVPDRAALFREICLVGTYVKRRCSLRLIEQTDGAISGDDLALSFREITGRLGDMGIDAQLFWSAAPLSSAAFALLCLDTFEYLLECERFSPRRTEVRLLPDSSLSIFLSPAAPGAAPPREELVRRGGPGFAVTCENLPDGYAVRLREGGAVPC
jgi:hypothetical protein